MLQAILMMLYAYSEEPESWLGQAMSGLFEGLITLFAGDDWKDMTLEQMLTDSPEEFNFIERQVYNRFKDSIADSLGVTEAELDSLMKEGGALNDLLKANGVTTSDITMGQLKALKDESPEALQNFIKENIFTDKVMTAILADAELSPLAVKIAANNPDLMEAAIRDAVPEQYHTLLTEGNMSLIRDQLASIPANEVNNAVKQLNSVLSGQVDVNQMIALSKEGALSTAMLNTLRGLDVTGADGITIADGKGGEIDLGEALRVSQALLTDRNIGALRAATAELSEEQLDQVSSLVNNMLTGGETDLEAMAQILQHEEMVDAVRTLVNKDTGILIPEGLMLGGVDISERASAPLAFLQSEGNLEALQAFAPTLASNESVRNAIRQATQATGALEKTTAGANLIAVLTLDAARGGNAALEFYNFADKADLSVLGEAGMTINGAAEGLKPTLQMLGIIEEASLEKETHVDRASLGDIAPTPASYGIPLMSNAMHSIA